MPERPSSGEPDDPELLDDGMRISGEVLSMRYDDGGILFSITPEGKISAVRLADDIGFVFDPTGPALSVNDKAVGLDSAEMIKEADGCKWFKLIAAGGRQKIYIGTQKTERIIAPFFIFLNPASKSFPECV